MRNGTRIYKLITLLIFGCVLNISFSQYSDTVTCSSLTYAIHYDQQACEDSCDGNYFIEIINGIGPYNYTVTTIQGYSSNSQTDSSLCVNNYSVIVEDLGTGVTCNSSFTVNPFSPINITTSVSSPTFYGACDAMAFINVSGGVPPYSFQWYDEFYTPLSGQIYSSINYLCPGTYHVRVWDNSPQCSTGPSSGPGGGGSNYITIIIYDNIQIVIDQIVPPSCPGACDGYFTYSLLGGSFTGGNGQYQDQFGYHTANAGQQVYYCDGSEGILEVYDWIANGYDTEYIDTPEWPIIDIAPNSTDELCVGNCDGTIEFIDNYSPGISQYSIDGGLTYLTNPLFDNLCPGSYSCFVMIQDSQGNWGCPIDLGNENIGGASNIPPSVNISSIDEQCASNCDGSISITDLIGNIQGVNIGVGYNSNPTITNLCPGSYDVWVQDDLGCETLISQEIISAGSNSNTTATDVQTACTSFTWIDGNTYTNSNSTATHTLTNTYGCDSIVTLDLTILQETSYTDIHVACDSFTWIDGNTYFTTNNTATYVLTNGAGCDSTITLDLTINASTTSIDNQSACGSYTWIDGNTYTSSNNSATHILQNANGCDSTITLNLTIGQPVNTTQAITECESYTWIDGNTYTSSNSSATFTTIGSNGCDSIITLNLTILPASSGIDVISSCGPYTWVDGNTYSVDNFSSTYTYQGVNGCDSIVTLNLTIHGTSQTTNYVSACNGYTWIDGLTYTVNTDSATFTMQSINGCDSIIVLNLQVTNLDNSVVDNSPTLISNATVSGYQWLNCSDDFSEIPGENGPSFTATTDGEYAVKITDNGCVDTSLCYIVENANISNGIPNDYELFFIPNDKKYQLSFPDVQTTCQIELIDLTGRIIASQKKFNSQVVAIKIPDIQGGYIIRYSSNDIPLGTKLVYL